MDGQAAHGVHAHPETLTPQPPPCSPPDLGNCSCGLPDPLTSRGPAQPLGLSGQPLICAASWWV